MHSIKTKLVITITLLVTVLFAMSSFLFVVEKQKEFAQDIFDRIVSFAELTAPKIVDLSGLYLEQKSFIYFKRDVSALTERFPELAGMKLVQYDGTILYDAATEANKQYAGELRKVDNDILLHQIQARNGSFLTQRGQVVYLKKDAQDKLVFVDDNENEINFAITNERIQYFVQPASNQNAVIYLIDYKSLDERVQQTVLRGILLAVFGIAIGILMAFLYARTITRPIFDLTKGADAIAAGNFEFRVPVTTKDELAMLANAFNKMAVDLDLSTKAMVYKERVTKELELASKIQSQILPKTLPVMKGIDIAAGLVPAEEIGGDCYDFLKVDQDNLLFYLGDVTGHGVPSGIVVSIANALVYHLAGTKDIQAIMVDLNKVIKQKTTSSMFLTMVMLNWNDALNKLQYVNAGHEQMIHFAAKEQKVSLTPTGGLALGMFADISKNVHIEEVQLEQNDLLVLYSDGIPECWKNEKDIYGMARFKEAVAKYSTLPTALEIRNALLADVKEFSAGYKQMDDITIIVLKRR